MRDPFMAFVRWLSRLGWYDEDTQIKRERRTGEAVRQADAGIRDADRAIRAAEDRVSATRQSYAEAGKRLSR